MTRAKDSSSPPLIHARSSRGKCPRIGSFSWALYRIKTSNRTDFGYTPSILVLLGSFGTIISAPYRQKTQTLQCYKHRMRLCSCRYGLKSRAAKTACFLVLLARQCFCVVFSRPESRFYGVTYLENAT